MPGPKTRPFGSAYVRGAGPPADAANSQSFATAPKAFVAAEVHRTYRGACWPCTHATRRSLQSAHREDARGGNGVVQTLRDRCRSRFLTARRSIRPGDTGNKG